ncbi:YafY family transcriptional regulator [Brevibacillus borstelensis]|uniref:helix-turn-helix transcriptional regulator n=1 Tax=Brevibacillus TaxID=55080 RepID=UPI0014901B33|nr:YafY family protein [Brevibacillus borstelensis]MCC0566795.1 YafY family transcriptional regulator [Brevibacillus borstelensis]MCM3473662.1 YafY family transcriptional regulator [Brevibacillus borstelensis]MCM3561899.1 YafY family transcriptional regulator [Brevibacillus borstelensis]MCM3593974.1 YafY family transcriptional regulator [Brevibacillus borstelensis]MED1854333.1 YafY family protein [Brevibacillus borstelensis]
MPKSKRLMELMMMVNRKRKFTVKELADQFEVSTRTILRDLQELSELGVPLYSEVGPHGGYQVLSERVLPPIAFKEDEAVAMFFASHALRHYSSLPFETQAASALNKFYLYMPGDVRDRIDQMKNRVDIVAPTRQKPVRHLSILLDGAIWQKVISIDYESREGGSIRHIQPVGIYARNGYWYCPAYCFLREDFRLFRGDRIRSAEYSSSDVAPLDLKHVHLGNWEEFTRKKIEWTRMYVVLSKEGVQRCEAELWRVPNLHIAEDGSGTIDGMIPTSEISFFADFFLGLGRNAVVKEPVIMVQLIRERLQEMIEMYDSDIQ